MAYAARVLNRRSLEELRDKYATMLAMRRRHDAGEEDLAEAKQQMTRLAARYPGALREIDELPLDEIERRIAQLEQTMQGVLPVEPWMRALARFHELARGALCAKRWLAGRKHVDAGIERAFAAELPSLAFPEDAGAWAGELDRIAAPPRGRVTDAVFARVARELGTSDQAARRLAFGAPRKERAG
jgi:hypothetical protein